MSRIFTGFAVFTLLTSAGCAAIQRSDAMDTERNLAASGFRMQFARTPAQVAKTAALPQRKLTPTTGPNGENRFVWADSTYCKCIYMGTEDAYDRYQKLQVKQQIAENEEAAAMDWGAWGPWY